MKRRVIVTLAMALLLTLFWTQGAFARSAPVTGAGVAYASQASADSQDQDGQTQDDEEATSQDGQTQDDEEATSQDGQTQDDEEATSQDGQTQDDEDATSQDGQTQDDEDADSQSSQEDDADVDAGEQNGEFEFSAIVLALPDGGSVGTWTVGDFTVDVTADTVIDGTPAAGSVVEVEGTQSADGVVHAAKISVEAPETAPAP